MLSFSNGGHGSARAGTLGNGAPGYFGGMRILLDECVPWPIHRLLTGHVCSTAQREGSGGVENGALAKTRRIEIRFIYYI